MKAQPQPNSAPQFVILSPCATFVQGPKKLTREPEKVDPMSRTVPDDSFTIAELFNRHKAGAPLPLGLERPISYGEDPTHNDLDVSKIARMDITEVNDLKTRVSDTLHFLNERSEAIKKAQNDAKNLQNATKGAEPHGSPA